MSPSSEDDLLPPAQDPSSSPDGAPLLPADRSLSAEASLFAHWEQPRPPVRIPHFGHLLLLASFALAGLLAATLAVFLGLHFHLFGIATRDQALHNVGYNLGSEMILYFVALALALLVFPSLWEQSFFTGIQWRGATALRLKRHLIFCALGCFLLAGLDSVLFSGPKDAPIDKIFRSPGAPWLMLIFGTTIAPFFEELFFRGFFLPSLCTAFDWARERIVHVAPPPLDLDGHPQWSMAAMLFGSLCASLPFAAIHLAQTGYAIGPFVLLVCVSLVLCAVRLVTRSLASSVLVHAAYNFLLFFVMLLGTGGFQHLEKL